MLADQDWIIASKRQIACDVGDEAVILHLDEGVYYSLNGVGARVWQWLEQPRRFQELVDRVVGEFEVERERCQSDLQELMQQLLAKQLVSVQAEAPEG